jgi:hypothetical protein
MLRALVRISDADAVEPQRPRGSGLLWIVGREEERDSEPLPQEQGAGEMEGVEALDDRGHGQGRALDDRSGQRDVRHDALDPGQLLACIGDPTVVQDALEAEPVDHPARFDVQELARVGAFSPRPDGQLLRLSNEDAQDGAGVEVDVHRWSRPSRRSATTSTARLVLTPRIA